MVMSFRMAPLVLTMWLEFRFEPVTPNRPVLVVTTDQSSLRSLHDMTTIHDTESKVIRVIFANDIVDGPSPDRREDC